MLITWLGACWVVGWGVGQGIEVRAPLSGDADTFDVVDAAVALLGVRRGLALDDDRSVIHLVASVIDQAERLLPHLIAEARGDGCSWHDIARLLGSCPIWCVVRPGDRCR
jgi:hypothetical protein